MLIARRTLARTKHRQADDNRRVRLTTVVGRRVEIAQHPRRQALRTVEEAVAIRSATRKFPVVLTHVLIAARLVVVETPVPPRMPAAHADRRALVDLAVEAEVREVAAVVVDVGGNQHQARTQ